MTEVLDEREDGTLCQRCGRRYRIDVQVTDEMWRCVSPDTGRGGLLCGPCIMMILEAVAAGDGSFGTYRLGPLDEGWTDAEVCPPKAEGRYIIAYRFGSLPLRIYVGDWLPGHGWNGLPGDVVVVYYRSPPALPQS